MCHLCNWFLFGLYLAANISTYTRVLFYKTNLCKTYCYMVICNFQGSDLPWSPVEWIEWLQGKTTLHGRLYGLLFNLRVGILWKEFSKIAGIFRTMNIFHILCYIYCIPTLLNLYVRGKAILLHCSLRKSRFFPFSMVSAKQENYWYHFYNVFGMTRSLTGD